MADPARLRQLATGEDKPDIGGVDKFVRGVGTGIAQMLGMPRFLTDAINTLGGIETGIADITQKLPTGREIQDYFSEHGLSYSPGEEPSDMLSRTYENIGAGLLPLGIAGKLTKAGPLLTELGAAAGGAAGGIGLEKTELGQRHPVAARAIGEISGGLTGGGATAIARRGGGAGIAYRGAKGAVETGLGTLRGPGAEKRAARRITDISLDPETVLTRQTIMGGTPEGEFLTPVQRSGDKRLAGLQRAVEEAEPEIAESMAIQRSDATKRLSTMLKEGNIEDFRGILENRLKQYGDEAQKLFDKIDTADNPANIQTRIVNKLDNAYEEARKYETQIWNSLPEDPAGKPTNLIGAYQDELSNITKGGDINEIDQFARRKLGSFRDIKPKESKILKPSGQPFTSDDISGTSLKGGELVNFKKKNVTAKELHQFYSRLGRRVRELSDQSGQVNKIRILNRLRHAALADMDELGTGEQYRQAISISRDLNEKFTQGAVGKMLGFARGRAPSETQALDVLVGRGGQEAKEVIQQALEANPQATDDIKNYLKTQFAMAVKNEKNNRINAKTADRFLKRYDRALDIFPDVKGELKEAVRTQKNVDELVGIKDVNEMSPLLMEKSAASVFLQSAPGEEMSNILRNKNLRPKYLKDLVQEASNDTTGKAKKGLQSAFGQELLKFSQKGVEDEITGMPFISGRRMATRLNELENTIKSSNLFSKDELSRLKRITQAFKGIENDLTAKVPKGGIISDIPAKLLQRPAQVLGAQAGGAISAGGMGGSLQTANIFSQEAKGFVGSLTNDEARNIIVRSVQDPELFNSLFTKVTSKNKERVWNKIISKSKNINMPKPPVSAVAPAATTIQSKDERRGQAQRLRSLL